MNKNRLVKCAGALSLLAASLPGYGDFTADVAVSTQISDNARKSSGNKISERQDEYSIGVSGDYENRLLDLKADYEASEHRFEKNSQADRSLLEGYAGLNIGKSNQPLNLLLSHSRRGLLNNPDQIDLLQNHDERQIFSAVPTARASVTNVDTLLLQGNYSIIDYRYNEFRNSESKGASLIWQHRFSSVDMVQTSVRHTEIEFDELPQNNYEYQIAMLAYSATLRAFSYILEVGYNKSTRDDGEEYSNPSYSATVNYTTGLNNFSLISDQRITDTSMGDANRSVTGGRWNSGIGSGDTSSNRVDQIERRSTELHWNTSMLCERCEINAYISVRDDNYLTLPEDNNERGAGVGFSYRFTKDSKINLRFDRREQRFGGEVAREKYTLDRGKVEYQYSWRNDVRFSAFVESESRKSENNNSDYDELVTGVSVAYVF